MASSSASETSVFRNLGHAPSAPCSARGPSWRTQLGCGRAPGPGLAIDRSTVHGDHHAVGQRLAITWLGHSTFLLNTPGGKSVLLDPWLTTNPSCPERLRKPSQVDVILASHGHADHIEDLVACARLSGAPVVAIYELCDWLGRKGIQHTSPMNKGGTQEIAGLSVSMTDARHSSGFVDGGHMVYMGEPCGFVIRLEDQRTIYYAGDTDVFSDMGLIGEMYRPEIAFLPIGDRFTMGPAGAARACAMLGVKQVIPMHWGTFPLLKGTPAALRALVEPLGVNVLELRPGETAD
jgi:L-ascorbate metabolism protein UlaG (beta-lactamase superfamily)